MNIKVLYEDNHLIAVFKPAGILSQGDKTGEISIFDEVKKYLKDTYKKPGNVFLGLLHRLDRPVSGIILFAKTSKGASRLSEQFRNQKVEKTYHAIVCGVPLQAGNPQIKKGVLKHFLIKDEKLKKGREAKDGKEANLYYEIIRSSNDYSLLKIKIDGGKFHQIRAQLSIASFPVLGDVKYKGKKWHNEKAIALCATQLSFYPATSEQLIALSIKLPEDWQKYIGF